MKTLRYEAAVEYDEFAPPQVLEHAKEKMRRHILTDQQYQREVLADLSEVRRPIEARIKTLEGFLEKRTYSIAEMMLRGDQIREERNRTVLLLDELKSVLRNINCIEEVRNRQLIAKSAH